MTAETFVQKSSIVKRIRAVMVSIVLFILVCFIAIYISNYNQLQDIQMLSTANNLLSLNTQAIESLNSTEQNMTSRRLNASPPWWPQPNASIARRCAKSSQSTGGRCTRAASPTPARSWTALLTSLRVRATVRNCANRPSEQGERNERIPDTPRAAPGRRSFGPCGEDRRRTE